MKKSRLVRRSLLGFLGAAALFGSAWGVTESASAEGFNFGIRIGQQPLPEPPRPYHRNDRYESPGEGAYWIKGHWEWQSDRWVWFPGYWEYPPHRAAVWAPSHSERRNDTYYYVPGRWNERDDRGYQDRNGR